MVHVTNGPNVAMRLVALEFLLGHGTALSRFPSTVWKELGHPCGAAC
jgi:hypothetical protein